MHQVLLYVCSAVYVKARRIDTTGLHNMVSAPHIQTTAMGILLWARVLSAHGRDIYTTQLEIYRLPLLQDQYARKKNRKSKAEDLTTLR